MARLMFPLSTRLGLLLCLTALLQTRAEGQDKKPFSPPKDRAGWESQRHELRDRVARALGLGEGVKAGSTPRLELRSRTTGSSLIIESFSIETTSPDVGRLSGVLVIPASASPSRPVPLILHLLAPGKSAHEAVDGRGLDGRPPAIQLARFGFAVLVLDTQANSTQGLQSHRVALNAALARPEFDAKRVGVTGFGASGSIALALMAIEDRINCGVFAIESKDFAPLGMLFGQGPSDRFADFDEPSFVSLLASLCAPRPISLLVGETLPFRSNSRVKALERVVKATYKLFVPEGTALSMNMYGEFEGHDSVSTRLQWISGLEHLDKHFRPQGPSPLGHDPEAEPEVDGRFLKLSESGIAGWSAEMSQRPGTWTWNDGVIACKPLGTNEFGWLRVPVEVDDFILRVEWRVPDKGNGGIFLRAKPVTWTLPPNDLSKPRLQALGLDWPSRTGLELQAQADPGDANRYSSGSLYRHAAPAANPTKPPGQWNRYTVRARGPRIEVWSNGQQVLDTSIDRYPETLSEPPMKGYIGLQNHGSPAEYRNVQLLRLGPDGSNR
jgi:Domain of Unknown Function (DUF1080)